MLIRNARLAGADNKYEQKDILIEAGIINAIEDSLNVDYGEKLDAKGKYVIPGLIDMNCNICSPGYEYKEDIRSLSKSAVKGGFTSVTCQPSTNPAIDNKTVVAFINSYGKQSLVNIFPYGSVTINCEGNEMAKIGEMVKAGIVGLSNIPGTESSNLLLNILRYSTMFKIPVVTLCNDHYISGQGVVNYGSISTKLGLIGIPREAEETILSRNIILAQHAKARLHITQVSTKGSVDIIRYAKSKGFDITCDTCPQYFTYTEDKADSFNTIAKIFPPLRTAEDVEAIKEGLADGTIDVISSGHRPEPIESKQVEFDRASFGISSIETAFRISYTELVKKNVISFHDLIQKMSTIPAKILGLENKGTISVGTDGDMVVFDDSAAGVINAHEFASKSRYSLHDGEEISGKIVYTLVNGEVVYLS